MVLRLEIHIYELVFSNVWPLDCWKCAADCYENNRHAFGRTRPAWAERAQFLFYLAGARNISHISSFMCVANFTFAEG